MKSLIVVVAWLMTATLAMAQSIPFPGPGGVAGGVNSQFNNSYVDATDQTTYTFASVDLGSATNRTCNSVVIGTRANAARTITAVTINGNAATCVTANNAGSGADIAALCTAASAAGTTGTVSVQMSAAMLRMAIGSYSIYKAGSCTPSNSNTTTNSGANPSTTLNVPAGGSAIGAGWGNSTVTATFTWTGLNKDFDVQPESASNGASGAHTNFAASQTGLTITAAIANIFSTNALAVASWGP
jgi:hypothetical protein